MKTNNISIVANQIEFGRHHCLATAGDCSLWRSSDSKGGLCSAVLADSKGFEDISVFERQGQAAVRGEEKSTDVFTRGEFITCIAREARDLLQYKQPAGSFPIDDQVSPEQPGRGLSRSQDLAFLAEAIKQSLKQAVLAKQS